MLIDQLFNETLSKSATVSTTYMTKVNSILEKIEARTQIWSTPRLKYKIPEQTINTQTYNDLINLFNLSKGMLNECKFIDPLDNKISQTESLLIGDGSVLQIYKKYNDSITKKIQLIDDSSFKLYINDKLSTLYTLNKLSGNITINSQLSQTDKITFSCSFFVKIRFDCDEIKSNFVSENKIRISEFNLVQVL